MTDPQHGGGPNPSDLAWIVLAFVVVGVLWLVETIVEAVT